MKNRRTEESEKEEIPLYRLGGVDAVRVFGGGEREREREREREKEKKREGEGVILSDK